MKISVIMAACNQGKFLKETVESAQQGLQGCPDWEIIIVDDQSTDGCCELVEQSERVLVHKPDKKLGVIHARNLAGRLAQGDVIITTDTHCYYPRRSLWRMANWTARQRAIFLPQVRMERGPETYSTVQGGKLAISDRGLRIDRPSVRREYPALFGSIYIMSREVWEWMGGWVELPGYWGGEEVINTVLAYRFGIPIVVLAHHTCTHRKYREHATYPWELPPHHPCMISHYLHAACFPNTYESVWKPLLKTHYPQWEPTADPSALREWIQQRSVWSEERFIRTVLGTEDLSQHPYIQRAYKLLERMNVRPQQTTPASVHTNEPQPVAPERRRRRRHRA